jgi:hypothetical protein
VFVKTITFNKLNIHLKSCSYFSKAHELKHLNCGDLMCDIGKTLKLCTCEDKIDKSKPYWTLSRKTVLQEKQPIILGMYIGPDYKSSEYMEKQIISQSILRQLNERCCFDFSNLPFDKDKLAIYLNRRKFEFTYSDSDKKWDVNSESPFKDNEVTRSVQAKGYVELTR